MRLVRYVRGWVGVIRWARRRKVGGVGKRAMRNGGFDQIHLLDRKMQSV